MEAVKAKMGSPPASQRVIPGEVLDAMERAASEVSRGEHYDSCIVPVFCGGAGTSINMNINEIIANRSLALLGRKAGEYDVVSPFDDANVFQSTNDVVPTSLKLAMMNRLDGLEAAINRLRAQVDGLEKKTDGILRIGYPQMQEAVPTSFGRLFSSYSGALSRDWWRISKARERIKTVNLGGSAIGTGITVPRYFIFEAVATLRALSGQPLVRGENLADATSNMDGVVEAHAVIKAHAVNLEKMVSDLRLLAAGITRDTGVSLPPRQAGSSIMPGKINPVIPEFVVGVCHRVYANDAAVSSLAGQGCLELNAYVPFIGQAVLESLEVLTACDTTMADNMMDGLTIEPSRAYGQLIASPSVTTALVPYIGYERAAVLAKMMKERGEDIFRVNAAGGCIDGELLIWLLRPDNLLRLGYAPSEVAEELKSAGRGQE
jgi:aspartate ammonia-lyase